MGEREEWFRACPPSDLSQHGWSSFSHVAADDTCHPLVEPLRLLCPCARDPSPSPGHCPRPWLLPGLVAVDGAVMARGTRTCLSPALGPLGQVPRSKEQAAAQRRHTDCQWARKRCPLAPNQDSAQMPLMVLRTGKVPECQRKQEPPQLV